MKYQFDITIGSHWPAIGEGHLPVGGFRKDVIVEFEPIEGITHLQAAEMELHKTMGKDTYHIWYWIPITESNA